MTASFGVHAHENGIAIKHMTNNIPAHTADSARRWAIIFERNIILPLFI
jgi:hypothetical protein